MSILGTTAEQQSKNSQAEAPRKTSADSPRDGDCHICKEITSSYAGDPGLWPIWLGFRDGNGKTRPYHTRCIIRALERAELAEAESPRQPSADCVQCGAPLKDGKCSVQPWHIAELREVSQHPVPAPEQTDDYWCPTCGRSFLQGGCTDKWHDKLGQVEHPEPALSRSVQRRIAAQKGKPVPTFEHPEPACAPKLYVYRCKECLGFHLTKHDPEQWAKLNRNDDPEEWEPVGSEVKPRTGESGIICRNCGIFPTHVTECSRYPGCIGAAIVESKPRTGDKS